MADGYEQYLRMASVEPRNRDFLEPDQGGKRTELFRGTKRSNNAISAIDSESCRCTTREIAAVAAKTDAMEC